MQYFNIVPSNFFVLNMDAVARVYFLHVYFSSKYKYIIDLLIRIYQINSNLWNRDLSVISRQH